MFRLYHHDAGKVLMAAIHWILFTELLCFTAFLAQHPQGQDLCYSG